MLQPTEQSAAAGEGGFESRVGREMKIIKLEMDMKRFLEFWLPGWERFTGVQRAACVDFGLSVSVLLLACCSESIFLSLLAGANLVRSYVRLTKSGVEIEE